MFTGREQNVTGTNRKIQRPHQRLPRQQSIPRVQEPRARCRIVTDSDLDVKKTYSTITLYDYKHTNFRGVCVTLELHRDGFKKFVSPKFNNGRGGHMTSEIIHRSHRYVKIKKKKISVI